MPTIRRRLLHRIAYVRRNRCSALLAALCLLILVNPLFVGSRVGTTSITFGLYTSSCLPSGRCGSAAAQMWVAALLAFVAFDAGMLDRLGGQPTRPLMLAGTALFTAVVTVALLRYVLDRRPIKTDKIFGAVAAYVLIAFTFTSLFGLLQLVDPGAFRDATLGGGDASLGWASPMYFSFTRGADLHRLRRDHPDQQPGAQPDRDRAGAGRDVRGLPGGPARQPLWQADEIAASGLRSGGARVEKFGGCRGGLVRKEIAAVFYIGNDASQGVPP